MKANIARRWDLAILAVILALALAIRLLGIDFGLPYVYYPDEAVIVNHAVAFGTGDLNPHYFLYPSLYMYVSFLIYGLSYVVGWLTGVFASTTDFVRLFFNDATLFYLPGRLITALSGVASVGVVYLLGRRAYNVRVGLVAAAFLTFNVLHVEFSHYVKTHVPAGLLVVVGLWLAWSIYDGKDRWRDYILAGVVAGLGASTIYHAGFVLVSIGVAHVLHWRDSSKDASRVRLLSPKLFMAVPASFAAFVFGTPFAILDWPTFVGELTSTAAVYHSSGVLERGIFYPFTSLLTTMGLPLGVVALLGLGYALLRRRPAGLILLSQPLFLGGFLMLFPTKEPQHMLIAFPALAILSASLLVDVVTWFIRPRTWRAVGLTLVALLLLVMPATSSFQNSYRLTLPDTRSVAKDWIEGHIPPASKIVMDSGKYYSGALGPPLRLSRWTLEQFIARTESPNEESLARRDGTRRVGYSGEAEYFRQQLQTLDHQPGYDIVQILHNRGSPRADVLTLDEYLAMGVQYAIVNSRVWKSYLPESEMAVRYPDKAARYRDFYEALESHATLLKEFSPSDNMVGPTLRIYKLPCEPATPTRPPMGTPIATWPLSGGADTEAITSTVAAQQGQGYIYYVATNGDDSNPGTEAQPFRTIQHAADLTRPGDTVLIRGGTYAPFWIKYSGAENQPITFRNYPGERPVIDGTLSSGKGIELKDHQHYTNGIGWIIIVGLEVSHASQEGLKGYRIHHVVIRNCSIHHSHEENILVSGSHHVTLEANRIYEAGEHNLYASGSYWTVVNNLFFGADYRIMQLYPYTHDRPEEFRHIKHWKIFNNVFAFNRYQTGLCLGSHYVGNIPGEVRDVEIYNNTFYGNAGRAIFLSLEHPDIKGVSIHHNVHYGNLAFIGGGTGEGTEYAEYDNYNVDPLFVHTDQYDFADNDFHLQSTSPAIDAGVEPRDVEGNLVTTDFDGNPRPRGAGYDIGAYESPFSARVTDLRIVAVVGDTPSLTVTLRWTAPVAAVTYTLRSSDTLLTTANWSHATIVSVPFTASEPGSSEWLTTPVDYAGGTIYLALKSQNSAGGWSELSNNAFWPHMGVYLPLIMKDYVSSS